MIDHRIIVCKLAAGTTQQQWVHLVPGGEFNGRDGRGPFTLEDAEAVIAASESYSGSNPIPIDYEHQIDIAPKNGMPAPAAGWISELQARDSGIWGLVRWTEKAAQFIANGEYRYISPVLAITKETGKIRFLLRAAITNNPNLTELTALFSTQHQTPQERSNMEALIAKLAKLLALPEGADEATVVAAIEKLQAAGKPDATNPEKFVPISEFERVVTELNSVHQGVAQQAAETHVASQIASGNMLPYLKDWGIALCRVNKPAFDAFIGRTGGAINKLFHPLDFSKQSAGTGGELLTADEKSICVRMGVSEAEFISSKKFIESGKA